MTIQLNGETKEVSAPTVTALVAELGLPAEMLLVEHDGKALLRSEWASTAVRDGSRIELLRIAAGG